MPFWLQVCPTQPMCTISAGEVDGHALLQGFGDALQDAGSDTAVLTQDIHISLASQDGLQTFLFRFF